MILDVLANKFSETSLRDNLNEDEVRAIWALQDLCEDQIAKIGIRPRPEIEWEQLMAAARKHVKTIPVEFLK